MVINYINVKKRKKDAQGRLTRESEIINPTPKKEVDTTKSFKSSDFENLAEYEKAKKKFTGYSTSTEAKGEAQSLEIERINALANIINPPTPEEISLAQQQEQQKTETTDLLTGNEQPTVAQRNVQAGMAAVNSIIQTFGGEAKSLQEQQLNLDNKGIAGVPAKVLLTTLGKVTTVNIPFTDGFTLAKLFSKSNSGNIKELTGDANEITGRARLIYADATSRGGDQAMAIEQLRLSEEAVRQRYNDANIALSASPDDIAEGVDFTEEIYSSLVVLQSYRFALERQQLTGEKNQALLTQATTPTA